MSFPKILILGQTFNKKEGGGVTMSNLFKGWPKDKIAVASNANLSKDLDSSVCEIYYQLGYNSKLHPFPLNIILPKIKCGLLRISNEYQKEATHENTSKSGKYKSVYQRVVKLLDFLGLYNIFYNLIPTPDFENWLKQYDPDIIYTQLASLELIRFTDKIQEITKKPVVIHMMDDWPSTISNTGLFKNTWHRIIDKELRSLIGKAALLLSISDTMAREYQERYRKKFTTFHNPIEIEFWKSYQRSDYKLPEKPVVLYAGRIGKGINKSLETMALAIVEVNKTMNTNLKFVIQSPEKPDWLKNYAFVTYKTPVAYTELPLVFAEADLLYLPYDFSDESIRFIKYSMPTKAPEYMVSGTPIIMFAPKETELVLNAEKGNWAKLVTENKIADLSAAIMDLLANEEVRKKIAVNAISIAEASYNSVMVRTRFRETISLTHSKKALHSQSNEIAEN